MAVAPAGLSRPSSRSARPSSRSARTGRDAVPRGSGRAAPQLRVLGPPRHTRRYVVAALLIAAVGIFGIVSLNALAAEAAFEARTLESEVTELSLRYDELTAEVAALSAPGRVRQVAREELGMVPAPAAGFLFAEAAPEGERLVGALDPLDPLDPLDAPVEPTAKDDTVKQALGER